MNTGRLVRSVSGQSAVDRTDNPPSLEGVSGVRLSGHESSQGTSIRPEGESDERKEQATESARDCVGLASKSAALTASVVEVCDSSLDAVPATVPTDGLHLQPLDQLAPAGSHDIAGRSPFLGDVVAAVVAEIEARRTMRDAAGRYAKSNTGAVVGGTNSDQLANALLPLRREIVAQVTADQGAADKALPATLGRLVEAFAEVTLLRAAVFQTMSGRPTSGKGHTRRILSAYLQLVDREQRLASAIGLERSKAAETRSFAEVLDEHEAGEEAGQP